MTRVVDVVDDYIEALLRDASIRVGLYPARTKAIEWGKLLTADECIDDAQRVLHIKKSTYVVHYLLNGKKLTNSFAEYFEKRTDMPFNSENIAFTNERRGVDVTLIDLFKQKISRFKNNFTHYTRDKCNMTVSRGENELGGKGKKLKEVRTHNEILELRKKKRAAKRACGGRNFFLNYYLSNGTKYIKVREIMFVNAQKNNFLHDVLAKKPLVLGEDMDWNRWERSFDPMFWMTPEERSKKAGENIDQECQVIRDEKDAVDALFGLLQSGTNNSITASAVNQVTNPTAALINDHFTAPVAADARADAYPSPLLGNANGLDAMEPLSIDLDKEINAIENEDDPLEFDNTDHSFLQKELHKIPERDPAGAATSAAIGVGGAAISATTTAVTLPSTESNFIPDIPEDNEERGRKEKERIDKLNQRKANSILNYTTQQKGGIAGTEKKKRKKKSLNSNTTTSSKNKKENKNNKVKEKNARNTNTLTGKRKKKQVPVLNAKKQVC